MTEWWVWVVGSALVFALALVAFLLVALTAKREGGQGELTVSYGSSSLQDSSTDLPGIPEPPKAGDALRYYIDRRQLSSRLLRREATAVTLQPISVRIRRYDLPTADGRRITATIEAKLSMVPRRKHARRAGPWMLALDGRERRQLLEQALTLTVVELAWDRARWAPTVESNPEPTREWITSRLECVLGNLGWRAENVRFIAKEEGRVIDLSL
jgi:hypothetical protein